MLTWYNFDDKNSILELEPKASLRLSNCDEDFLILQAAHLNAAQTLAPVAISATTAIQTSA